MLEQDPNQTPQDWKQQALYYLGRLRLRARFYLRKVLPPVTKERLAEVQVNLRESSAPDFDYFVLVFLSCMIATLGMLDNSAATIIGAMLVAPLMSPILGVGLASLRGDTRLLRDAFSALVRGAILAVALSILITWSNDLLPFISLQDLPDTVTSLTRPNPIHLGVALAGGLAATFALVQPQLSAALPGVAIATALMPPLCAIGVSLAMGEMDAAQGALLLFITNAVTIAASSIFLFYLMGFTLGRRAGGDTVLPRSLRISLGLMVVLLIPLGWQSYLFVQDANLNRQINEIAQEQVEQFGAELSDIGWAWIEVLDEDTGKTNEIIKIDIELKINPEKELRSEDGILIQENIANFLNHTVQLEILRVDATIIDPSIPPTLTPTPTLGPSPTITHTATATNTSTPAFTDTPTPSNTPTPTYTPTPGLAEITLREGAALRQSPEGPRIGWLRRGDQVRVLYGYEIVGGWVWIEVRDAEGRVGWIPQYVSQAITETPTRTPTPTITATPSPTLLETATPEP